MASPKTDFNPFVRRSPIQRIKDAGRYLLRLPRQLWNGYRQWPKGFRYAFTALGILAILGAAYYVGMRLYNRSQNQQIQAEKVALNDAIQKGEPKEKLLDLANKILALNAEEPQTLARKAAIESGEGDPKDHQVMVYLFRNHQKQWQNKESTPEERAKGLANLRRECERRLKAFEKDYYAHLLMVEICRSERDLDGLKRHLAAIAEPRVNNVNLNELMLYSAVQHLKELRQDLTVIRSFIAELIGSTLSTQAVSDYEPNHQVLLLALYTETFELPKLPLTTATTWPNAMTIAQKCLEGAEAKGEATTVKHVAYLGGAFANGLTQMRSANQISEPQRQEYSKELEARTQKAWNSVLGKEPKLPMAYIGLLESYNRSRMLTETFATLNTGLEMCGDNPELLKLYASVRMQNNQDMLAYERLKIAAERNPEVPDYWLVAARAAEKGGRIDLARDALDRVKQRMEKMPDDAARKNAMAAINEMIAALYTKNGVPHIVLNALSSMPDTELVRMPFACQCLTRALAEIGDTERLDAFLEAARKFSLEVGNPQPAFNAAQGVQDALPPTVARAQQVAEYLEPIIARWMIQFPPASQLQAAALVRNAEMQPSAPDAAVLARRAIDALQRASSLDPNHAQTCAELLNLRIRSEKDPAKAVLEVGPLVAKIDSLTTEQAAVLGMVYVANKQFGDAIRVLQPYTQGQATPSSLIQLALAYHGQGRSADAEGALSRASQLPVSMSDRDRADYTAARDLLSREKK